MDIGHSSGRRYLFSAAAVCSNEILCYVMVTLPLKVKRQFKAVLFRGCGGDGSSAGELGVQRGQSGWGFCPVVPAMWGLAMEHGRPRVDTQEPHVTVCVRGLGTGWVQLGGFSFLPLNNKNLHRGFFCYWASEERPTRVFSLFYFPFIIYLVCSACKFIQGWNKYTYLEDVSAWVHKSFGIKDHSEKLNYFVAGKARRKQTRWHRRLPPPLRLLRLVLAHPGNAKRLTSRWQIK